MRTRITQLSISADRYLRGCLAPQATLDLKTGDKRKRNSNIFRSSRPGTGGARHSQGKRAGSADPEIRRDKRTGKATTGYARLVNTRLLQDLPTPLASPESPTVFERAQAFVIVDRKLRFEEPEARGSLANSLLTPWVPGSRNSAKESVKSQVQGFLLTRLGDPRTKQANWRHVDKIKTDIMRKWLSRAGLKAFFDVIANHAEEISYTVERSGTRIWKRRGLTTPGLRSARMCMPRPKGYANLADIFAAARRDQQPIRIADQNGTHSLLGMEPQWQPSCLAREWKNAPKIGLPEYQKDELTDECLPFPDGPDGARQGKGLWHTGSKSGRWQNIAADFIARRCGFRLGPRDWMPK